jgi:SAM-dependent methyltransferase
MVADALAVRDGLYPPMEDEAAAPLRHLFRVRRMFADLPDAVGRRASKDASTAREEAIAADLPDYYAQDFPLPDRRLSHRPFGEALRRAGRDAVHGAAGPMRRTLLGPIAEFMRGRDQRKVTLLDVACGTGRFLRQVRLAYPAMTLKGLDLSRAYLDEAARHLEGLRGAEMIEAPAERMPLSRRQRRHRHLDLPVPRVAARCAPAGDGRGGARAQAGGLFVFMDSLQMGDKPGWDGMLEAFPHRFHEPYYRHYALDDLDGMFSAAGLALRAQSLPFLVQADGAVKE